jgi:hypothetical protein
LSALIAVFTASVAAAGPVAEAAQRAEALQAEGKTAEALGALDEAMTTVWTQGPLAFKKVVLVDSVGGLGTYSERPNRTFRPDEKLKVYVEPVGYGFGTAGSAAKIGFTADLTIENTTGQVLTEAKDLFSISVDSAPDRREFGMTLAFGVPYLRPGDYIASFTVHDQNSSKVGSFELPFSVSAPAAQQ